MRHLLDTQTLALRALRILDVAEDMSDTQSARSKSSRRCAADRGGFPTRPRPILFEAAAKRLLRRRYSNFAAKGSSVSKGESLKDTAQSVRGDGSRCALVIPPCCLRCSTHSRQARISAGLANAGDGTHETPDPGAARRLHDSQAPFGGTSRGRDFAGTPRGHLSRTCCIPASPDRQACGCSRD